MAKLEYHLLKVVDFLIQPPTEEIYIDFALTHLSFSSCLKIGVLNYMKVALITNCLRKYNPRLAVLTATKHVLAKWGGPSQSVLRKIFEALDIDEKQFHVVESAFIADLNPLIAYFSENQLEFIFAFLDE